MQRQCAESCIAGTDADPIRNAEWWTGRAGVRALGTSPLLRGCDIALQAGRPQMMRHNVKLAAGGLQVRGSFVPLVGNLCGLVGQRQIEVQRRKLGGADLRQARP